MKKQELNNEGLPKQRSRSPFWIFFKFLFITLCTILVILGCIFGIWVFKSIQSSYEEGINLTWFDIEKSPTIYDKDGNEIFQIYGILDNRYIGHYVPLSDISPYLPKAIVAIEDERFYQNRGFDVKRTIGAALEYFKGKVTSFLFNDSNDTKRSYGGSTITQQLIKNVTGENEQTIARKLTEIGRSFYLEENMSKNTIIESYLNAIEYGQHSSGIYEASLTYFGKLPNELDLAECATIAAVINAPSKYSPYTSSKTLEGLMKRKNKVLDKMYSLGFITKTELEQAKMTNPTFQPQGTYVSQERILFEYLTPAMSQARELVQDYYLFHFNKEITNEQAKQVLYTENVQIYTNIDTAYQYAAKDAFQNATDILGQDTDLEGAFILTTPDGKVRAMIGSRFNAIDHAYKSVRPTGSAMKPLVSYAPAFDMGLYAPSSLVNDTKLFIPSGKDTWSPKNFDRTYHGTCTIKQAIGKSYNTIPVQLLTEIGIDTSVSYLTNMGINTILPSDKYYPMAIGGINGISPFEMCQAYNVFNNDGRRKNLDLIQRLVINGVELKPSDNYYPVISPNANDMMRECLQYVVTDGTGRKAQISNHTTYAKTGTTSDVKDIWTCGFTDDVTATVWIGYDTPKDIGKGSGYAAQIFNRLVTLYYEMQ